MVGSKAKLEEEQVSALERIKKLAVMAMFADEELFDVLVLKGGNAMDLIHRLSSRASIDLDFSMKHDFPDGIEEFRARVERALKNTFRNGNYEVFDVRMEERPNQVTEDMADFWGGYGVEFKIITPDLFEKCAGDINELRKHAIRIGQGQRFLIDISRFEYVEKKEVADLDGYRIYVYSPAMIVCEKLRAICQQLEEYGPIIKRSRAGSPRARDFIDIHILVTALAIDVGSSQIHEILAEMFRLKRVPLSFLGNIHTQREFHRVGFPSVRDTVKAGVELQEFNFYFDFVLELVAKLKPLWDV
jgi:hypothetical protein